MKTIFKLFILSIFISGVLNAVQDINYELTMDSTIVDESAGKAYLFVRIDPKITNSSEQITVNYATQNGSAINPDDYLSKTGSVKFNKNVLSQLVIINIVDNTLFEAQEEFYVKLSNATLAYKQNNNTVSIANDKGIVTINDNDVALVLPKLYVDNKVTVNESAGFIEVKVYLDKPSAFDVTFSYTTSDNTAKEVTDYTLTAGAGIIKATQTSTTIKIPIIDDSTSNESGETFYFDISNVSTNAVFGNKRNEIEIIDNDIAVSISINDATTTEQNTNHKIQTKLILSQALAFDIDVMVETGDGTDPDVLKNATEGFDYNKYAEKVTIPAGTTEKIIELEIIGDVIQENLEFFNIQITGISVGGIIIDKGIGKVTIFDNDNTEGCSPYTGLITINEYQNNPTYKDATHPLASNSGMVPGNYIEIKYIDFLVKQYINENWTISVISSAGSGTKGWGQSDAACVDPRYEVFTFDNNIMGKEGWIVIKDENGNEVDRLQILDEDEKLYTPECDSFPYDTDFESSAQNKDIFRDPDGTGDWYDVGSGANSGGSRCIDKDGQTGLVFTEFDALDVDEEIPTKIFNHQSVPIKTKVANENFDIRNISILVETGELKPSNTLIKVYFADAIYGTKLTTSTNFGKFVKFNNQEEVTSTAYNYAISERKVRLLFEYCEEGGVTSDWTNCYGAANIPENQRRSHSRNIFSIRPESLKLNVLNGGTSDYFYPYAPSTKINLLKAGENYITLFSAIKPSIWGTNFVATNYNQFKNNLSLSVKKYFKDGSEDINNDLVGVASWDDTNFEVYQGRVLLRGLGKTTYSDVGNIDLTVMDKEWASVDNDDTPQDCNSTSHTYICGSQNVTFIPHHFKALDFAMENHGGASNNFTYLANEVEEMHATIAATIAAVAKDDSITKNFKSPTDLYYENPVSVTPVAKKDTYKYPDANALVIDNKEIGFGLDTNPAGTRMISATETDFPIGFNFTRDINEEANPFKVSGEEAGITIESTYTDGGQTEIISGRAMGDLIKPIDCDTDDTCENKNADNNVTFYYGVASPSKLFYENEGGQTADTPISINVYCDLGYTACQDLEIDTINGQTDQSQYWVSVNHDATRGDGNITITQGAVLEGASADWSITKTNVEPIDGIDGNIAVDRGTGVVPLTVAVDIDNANSAEWLIFNPETDNVLKAPPSPYYKVRFIGGSDWSGIGETGSVTNTNSSTNQVNRLTW